MAQKARIFALAAVAAAALFSATPSLAQDPPIRVASNDTARPTSAGDISGNVSSFFGNLGKGVTIRKPYEEYDVVSRGVVPGKGPGYCLKGESMPHLNSASNVVSLGVIPCSTLEQSGAFQRVAKAATATSPSGVAGATGGEAAIDPSKQCTYFQKPVDDGTGDQWCMMRDGMVIGRVHYVMNKETGNYEQTLTRLKKPVSSGILSAGGGVDGAGNVKLPANVQAGWDNLDAMKAQGLAKIQADQATRDSQTASNRQARKEAFKSKLGLD